MAKLDTTRGRLHAEGMERRRQKRLERRFGKPAPIKDKKDATPKK